jgi:hypothetical protein
MGIGVGHVGEAAPDGVSAITILYIPALSIISLLFDEQSALRGIVF